MNIQPPTEDGGKDKTMYISPACLWFDKINSKPLRQKSAKYLPFAPLLLVYNSRHLHLHFQRILQSIFFINSDRFVCPLIFIVSPSQLPAQAGPLPST